MFRSLVYCGDKNLKNEILRVFNTIPAIQVEYFSAFAELDEFFPDSLPFLIIIAENFSASYGNLHSLFSNYPQTYFIYYYPFLQSDALTFGELENFSHIIAGEKREQYLEGILKELVRNFWKKIPYGKLGFSYGQLSLRIKKVMNYIESQDLKNCVTAKIARQLDISQGYLSQEFKRETGLSFRMFMQKLLDHYERIIFNRLKLSAKDAAQLLGYSELSSFSRSFKKRKGYPPSQQKVHQYKTDTLSV
jgi:AraC-like DNA-binding protein